MRSIAPIMENARTANRSLSIRALADSDVPQIIAACADWSELAPYGPPFWRPRSAAELRRKVAATAGPQPATDYTFVLESNKRIVGECSLHGIDWRNGFAQVGVCIWRPADRQRGYGRAAVEHAVNWGLNFLGLVRLEAWVVAGNDQSLVLFNKMGFVEEGLLRKRYLCGGRRLDIHVLALTAARS